MEVKINNRIIGFLPLLVGILLFYTGETGRLNLAVKIIGLLTVLKGFIIIFGSDDKHRGLIGYVIDATDIAYPSRPTETITGFFNGIIIKKF